MTCVRLAGMMRPGAWLKGKRTNQLLEPLAPVVDGQVSDGRLTGGAHPYLPKVAFTPPAHELAQVYMQSPAVTGMKSALEERLRAAGFPDLDTAMANHMREADESAPGVLVLDVEVGKARTPTADRFRELLEHAVRIAEINLEANPPAGASAPA